MSPVATLVERKTRFLMLVALPRGDHKADAVADALATAIAALPQQLAKSLTWDLGHEMAQHQRFTNTTGMQVYFCDPKSPWQRGSAAATRTPTASCVSTYPAGSTSGHPPRPDLDAIAQELNERPRQTLGFKTPSQALDEVLR
jgi:IS30 family transposase